MYNCRENSGCNRDDHGEDGAKDHGDRSADVEGADNGDDEAGGGGGDDDNDEAGGNEVGDEGVCHEGGVDDGEAGGDDDEGGGDEMKCGTSTVPENSSIV